jgi:hypothetical protein
MITVGTKVYVTDFTDFFLGEGCVKKIKDGKATIKLDGKPGEYVYNVDDLEEVKAPMSKKRKKD